MSKIAEQYVYSVRRKKVNANIRHCQAHPSRVQLDSTKVVSHDSQTDSVAIRLEDLDRNSSWKMLDFQRVSGRGAALTRGGRRIPWGEFPDFRGFCETISRPATTGSCSRERSENARRTNLFL
jgi:hypothetical protein